MPCAACATVLMKGRSASAFLLAILPPYARRSKSLQVLIPILYLKGVSTGDFDEALLALAYTWFRTTEITKEFHAL